MRMEGSIITVVEPSKSQTSIRKNHGRKPEGSGEKADLLLLPDQERRSYKIPGRLLRKLNEGFRRTDADSRAVFVAQRLKWHGLQYNRFLLLCNVILDHELG